MVVGIDWRATGELGITVGLALVQGIALSREMGVVGIGFSNADFKLRCSERCKKESKWNDGGEMHSWWIECGSVRC